MMEFDEAFWRLKSFEIPDGSDPACESVRKVLARLLASRAVSLGELQTARDIVGRKGGVGAHAYLFLVGMFASLRDGNTAFNLSREENKNGKLLVDACRRNADDADQAGFDAFGVEVADMWPVAVEAASSLKDDVIKQDSNGLWYFVRYGDAVTRVSQMIKDRLSGSGDCLSDEELQAVVRYSKGDGAGEYSLGAEQQRTVRAAVENNLTVITGGPGTGKTTIVCSILRALIKKIGLKVADVVLAAPTGRAGQRMGEALRKQCETALGDDSEVCNAIATLTGTTVHSLLGGYGPKWKYNEQNPLPHKLVVVDECSMVDLLLMRSLLGALRKDCRLVLLGDKNQLPSVEAGAVLGDLMLWGRNGRESAFPELTESHRFTGRLKVCAEEFNEGKSDAIMSSESRLPVPSVASWMVTLSSPKSINGCFWYELSGEGLPQKMDELLCEWGQAHGLGKAGALVEAARKIKDGDEAFDGKCSDAARKLFEVLDASRILTVVRKGAFGVQHVNELFLKERLGRNPVQPLVDSGIPVIVTVNTRSLNLFNGDVGVTVKTPKRGVYVLFPRGESVVCCPVSKLPEHELAYAMTVHKSQGSEFENVMVVLPNDVDHPLLNQQIVYTGITRAKKRAVLVGTKAALDTALKRKVERDTGIR